jgi:arylsulfatase A
VLRITACVASVLLASITPTSARQSPPLRPNIVIILADDLGYGDIGAFNPKSRIPTPHVDRLAREGVRYIDAHTNSSVCTPTRYGLLTGRYAWRTNLKRGVLWGEGDPLIEPGRLTLASMLKAQGYTTAAIGKWHLGVDWTPKPGATPTTRTRNQVQWIDFTKPFGRGPTTLGFDSFFGIAASLDMPPYAYMENDRVPSPPTTTLPGVAEGDPAFYRPGPASPGFHPETVLRDFTARAVDEIRRRAKDASRRPFFLYVALAAPHTPVMPTAPFRGRTGIGPYGDFVAETDAAVGDVLNAIDEAGIADNTLVLFTSDNGPAPLGGIGEAGRHGHDASGGWRGVKAGLYEGGHRVPFVIRWPAVIRAGSTSRRLIATTDVVATVADLVGSRLPDGAGEDSVSFAANLRDPKSDVDRKAPLVLHSQNGSFAIRQGPWKLILTQGSGAEGDARTDAAAVGVPPKQLYNLEKDPTEKTNAIAEQADVARKLEAALDAIKSSDSATQTRTGTIPAGLFYEESGSGEPIVLIHAFSVDRRMWEPQIAALETRFRVVRYDLRGHGRSPASSDPYTGYGDLRALLDELKIEKAALIGLSAGAEVALNFAIVHPERVSRLVLAAPGLSGYRTPPLPWFKPVFEAAGAGQPERAAQLWAQTPIMALHSNRAASTTVVDLVKSNAHLWTLKRTEQPLSPPAAGRLAEVRSPTLVIVGDEDLPHIREIANILIKEIATARLVTIPGAGHLVSLDTPEAFNKAVVAFLSGETR